MKSIRILVTVVVVIIGMAASFAFTTAKRTYQTFRYDPTGNKRLIQTRQPLSIDVAELVNTAKWASGIPPVTFTLTGIYLRAISFDLDAVADGGNDGALTLQEALDAIEYSYAGGTFPVVITIGTTPITLHKSDSNLN